MLVRLFTRNFGVFRDGFDLSLEAVNLPSDTDRGYFETTVDAMDRPLRLLRLAAIYGPNGAGKSTVIRAAHALSQLVTRSGPDLQEGESVPFYDPFRLDEETREAPCELGCEVTVGSRAVEYRIAFTSESVHSEQIKERRRGEDRVLLSRDATGQIAVDKSLKKMMSVDLASVTRSNAAALSIAALLKQDALLPIYHAVHSSLNSLLPDNTGMPPSLNYSLRRLHDDPAFREWALHRLLIPADIGIADVTTRLRGVPIPDEYQDELRSVAEFEGDGKLSLVHVEPVFSHHGVAGDFQLEMTDQSAGTRKVLALAGPWYEMVRQQITAFVDELSASLHPTLLIALLDALNAGPARRPSQLVFTIHDPSPLEGVLRRDQVYFTEKNEQGVARLYAMSEFGDRVEHNARKRYLEGRYGALPRTPDFSGIFDGTEE